MERMKKIKEILVEQVYEELKHNLEHVNIHELGEVIDMIKDMEQSIYFCLKIKNMEKCGCHKHVIMVESPDETIEDELTTEELIEELQLRAADASSAEKATMHTQLISLANKLNTTKE